MTNVPLRKEQFDVKEVIKEAFPTVLAFTMSGMYSIVDGIL